MAQGKLLRRDRAAQQENLTQLRKTRGPVRGRTERISPMRLLTCSLLCTAVMCVLFQPIAFAQPLGKGNTGGPPSGGTGKGIAGVGQQGGSALGKNPGNFQGRNPGRITDPSTARPGTAQGTGQGLGPGTHPGNYQGRNPGNIANAGAPRPGTTPGTGQGLGLGKHPGNYQGRNPGKIIDPSTTRPGPTPGTSQHPGIGTHPGNYQGRNPGKITDPSTARLGQTGPSTPHIPTEHSTQPEARVPGNFKKRELGQMSPRNPGKPLNPADTVSLDAPRSGTSSHDSMPSEVLPRVQGPTGLKNILDN